MSEYLVSIEGCDQTSRVLLELTEDQAQGIRRLAEASRAARPYDCYPVVSIGTEVSAEQRADVTEQLAYARELAEGRSR